MNHKIELDVPESKLAFAVEFLKSISFIKNVKAILPNEIKNKKIQDNIIAYETGENQPVKLSLAELKHILNA